MTRRICLHGAESTGKSTLAPRLAARLGGLVVPEYGRTYAEANGTGFDEADLLAIFRGHVAATHAALAQGPRWLVSDTDPLMTQAWAVMLLGRRLPEIDAWDEVADLYLVPAMDLSWEEDGTRLFGSDLARRQFMDVAIGELERRRLPWAWVEGEGDARLASALAAVEAAEFA
ncbi:MULTISPECIES: AAA family ATPase [unclassified Sphingopyxis]|jgi:NadR type nicotinamide-nucleotide adenylyltransferase|uniref:AAA family ATPase n=1 Tax=unclassified Sphingopyxis TaxID=2614943 RepID=UPI0008693FE4|nr:MULTISPECIES: AAA family ATPase [unclassified Sphingopyxis]AVA15985.1 N-acetylglucosamine-6-phosphate isomerase [Sphingopyxis sp. MG]ODU29916.1 MAG: N-acetylglucosamine-6-phosphate isomerase [Sphingopyxis sp. SCN 67-31]